MAKLRKTLGTINSPNIQKLMRLIERQSKSTLIIWAAAYLENNYIPIYKDYYPDDERPALAINSMVRWLNKEIKLPEAKSYILDCHRAAREAEDNPIAQAAARAIGQGASIIHSARHSLGIAFYGGAAMAYKIAGLNSNQEIYNALAEKEFRKIYDSLKKAAVKDKENPVTINWNL